MAVQVGFLPPGVLSQEQKIAQPKLTMLPSVGRKVGKEFCFAPIPIDWSNIGAMLFRTFRALFIGSYRLTAL